MKKQRLYGVTGQLNYTPTFRFQLVAQEAPRVQASLFGLELEPQTEPPCDHPDTQLQRTFDGREESTCVVCGRVVPTASPAAEICSACRSLDTTAGLVALCGCQCHGRRFGGAR